MQIPVCHHFWKNGENAQWHPAVFPVPEIETQIKNDYQALAARKPPSGKYGAYTVFFDYRPSRDVFGRAIMPISFAFYKNFPDDARLAEKILAELARTPATQSRLDLPDTPKAAAQQPKSRKKYFLWLVPAIILLAAIFWLIARPEPERAIQATQKAEPLPVKNPTRQVPVADEQAAGQSMRKEPKTDICRRPDIWPALLKCPRVYVEKRCRGETTAAFRQFRQEDEACRPAYGKLAPWSSKLPFLREGAAIGHDDARALEQFLRK